MNDDEDEVAEEAADEKVSDDEEEHDKDERDRFKTERSTMLSIGKSGRTWDNLPDSLGKKCFSFRIIDFIKFESKMKYHSITCIIRRELWHNIIFLPVYIDINLIK